MNALLALAVAALFATGVHAMLKGDLIRVVIGMTLVLYSVNLFLVAAGVTRGRAPIHPLPAGATVTDPLVQALVLTAIVIGAGTTAVMIGLVYRGYSVYRTVDQAVVSGADEQDEGGHEGGRSR